jgi:ABC-type multidrug transport system ATPase subunit
MSSLARAAPVSVEMVSLSNPESADIESNESNSLDTASLLRTTPKRVYNRPIIALNAPISLILDGLSYSVPSTTSTSTTAVTTTPILSDITCKFPSSQLTAILGSSGSGKTTLLDILAGRGKSGTVSGEIYVNGTSVDPNTTNNSNSLFNTLTSYILQDDEFPPSLTVREAVTFVSRLYGTHSPRNIDALLRTLQLTAVSDSLIGSKLNRGISGGQQRRLSIAIGLVSNPKLLVLDEPTSGLDSANALRVMRCLNSLAMDMKLTVITSIHQPRSSLFHSFTNILILHSGIVAYFGPTNGASKYFETTLQRELPSMTNPADFILDALDGIVYDDDDDDSAAAPPASLVAQNFTKSTFFQSMSSTLTSVERRKIMTANLGAPPEIRSPPPSCYDRTRALISRTWTAKMRANSELKLTPTVVIFMAVVCGSLFYHIPTSASMEGDTSDAWHRLNALLYGIILFSLLSMPQLGTYQQSRVLFQRERAAGMYGPLEFVLAVTLTDVPLQVAITVLFGSVMYYLVQFQGSFPFYCLTLYMVLTFGHAMSHVVALLSKDAAGAMALCMSFIAFSFLLNGQVLYERDVSEHWRWLFQLSFIFNANEMIAVNEFQAPVLEENWGPVSSEDSPPGWFGWGPAEKTKGAMMLLFYIVLLRVATYLLLRFKYKERR